MSSVIDLSNAKDVDMEVYDPTRTYLGKDRIAEFLMAPLTGDLTEVPGVGPKTAAKLAEEEHGSVRNTYQLLGKFLEMREVNDTCVTHCTRFMHWLKLKGLTKHKTSVTTCVAEKVSTWIPIMYDPSAFAE